MATTNDKMAASAGSNTDAPREGVVKKADWFSTQPVELAPFSPTSLPPSGLMITDTPTAPATHDVPPASGGEKNA